jgi:hypothetical protein
MTDRKTPAEEADIIDGVAVERKGASTASGAAGRKRRPADNQAADTSGARSSGSDGQTDHGAADMPRQAGGGVSMPVPVPVLVLVVLVSALLSAGVAIAVQEWRAASRIKALQTEVTTLATQLEETGLVARAAQGETTRLAGQISERLAGLEAAMPDDPQAVIGDLAAAQGNLAAAQGDLLRRLEALEVAPAPLAGMAASSDIMLTHAGLTVASAMLADSLIGADAGRWLPVLDDLRAAGLDPGSLASLRAALSPPPPSTSQLLAEASAMLPALRDAGRDSAADWWSSTTDTLAGFITLRRQDQVDDPAVPDTSSPLAGFESAIARGKLDQALQAAADLAIALPDQSTEITVWRVAAEQRLRADEALAAFSAQMVARLAARLAALGSAGKAE